MSARSSGARRLGHQRLTLARHAKSSWRFGNLDDFSRPLNGRGLRDCVKAVPLMAKHIPRPDLILSSDAVRCVQTCQALADALGVFEDRILLDNDLYLATHRALLKRIHGVSSDVQHVLVVAHNPGLSELCNYLLPEPLQDLPTLAVASLQLNLGGWAELGRGGAALESLMLPRDMLKEHGR